MEAKNNPQSARVIKCVTPGCPSLPLTGRRTQPSHNLSSILASQFPNDRGENSSRRAGGHARKRKAAFIADANINSAQSQ